VKLVLLIIMVCGQPVEYVIKDGIGQSNPQKLNSAKRINTLTTILSTKPDIIFYKIDGTCT